MHYIGTDSRRRRRHPVTIAPACSRYNVRELPPRYLELIGAPRRERAAGCGDRREDAAILGLRTAADNTDDGGELLLLPPSRCSYAQQFRHGIPYPDRRSVLSACRHVSLLARSFFPAIALSLSHSLSLSLTHTHSLSARL